MSIAISGTESEVDIATSESDDEFVFGWGRKTQKRLYEWRWFW